MDTTTTTRLRHWQVERKVGGDWLRTDWTVSGADADEANRDLGYYCGRLGWDLRLGREVHPPEHHRYCSIGWVLLD